MVVMETEKPTATMAWGQRCRHHRLWDSKQILVPQWRWGHGRQARWLAVNVCSARSTRCPDTRQTDRTAENPPRRRPGPQRGAESEPSGWGGGPAPTLCPPLTTPGCRIKAGSSPSSGPFSWALTMGHGEQGWAGDSQGAPGSSAPVMWLHTCARDQPQSGEILEGSRELLLTVA